MLEGVVSGVTEAPDRLLAYGEHGIGKSTFAASCPAPFVIQTEDGYNTIGCDRTPVCETWQQVVDWITALIREGHQYTTVVLDTLDALERLIWAEVCKSYNYKGERGGSVKAIEEIAFSKGPILAAQEWWPMLLRGLEGCRRKGMHVLCVAHAKTEKVKSPDVEDYLATSPRIDRRASALVCEWSDSVLLIRNKVVLNESKAVGLGVEGVATPAPTHRAKNRYGITQPFPLSPGNGWSEYQSAKSVGGDNHATN